MIILHNCTKINTKCCISSIPQGIAYHQNEVLYIISPTGCISSSRQNFYTHPSGMMIYAELCSAMIYTLKRDDIPSLSAWIKKSRSEERDFLARPEGFEPPIFRIGICCVIQLRHGRRYSFVPYFTPFRRFCQLKICKIHGSDFLFFGVFPQFFRQLIGKQNGAYFPFEHNVHPSFL